MSDSDCLFCKIVHGTIPSKKLLETDELLAFADVNPQAPFHALVIPKKHIASLNEAEEADAALLGRLLLAARQVAMENGLAEDGYRLVNNVGQHGGQTVFHIHIHILGGRQLSWPPG